MLGAAPASHERDPSSARPSDAGLAEQCICPTCPTYDRCMGDAAERFFCGRGQSACGPFIRGCRCETCPVWRQRRLTSYYYCHEGPAR